MDYTLKTRSLQSLVKDMEKGTISLSHKLQRPEGQWNKKQKSNLIDSLLRHYPINPTYGIVETDGTLSIIDGVQRLSTIRDFIGSKFSLSKDMENVIINGEEKNLSGLKFNKLDEDTQSEILQSFRCIECLIVLKKMSVKCLLGRMQGNLYQTNLCELCMNQMILAMWSTLLLTIHLWIKLCRQYSAKMELIGI